MPRDLKECRMTLIRIRQRDNTATTYLPVWFDFMEITKGNSVASPIKNMQFISVSNRGYSEIIRNLTKNKMLVTQVYEQGYCQLRKQNHFFQL